MDLGLDKTAINYNCLRHQNLNPSLPVGGGTKIADRLDSTSDIKIDLEPVMKLMKLFFSYSHIDEQLRNRLETHLSTLKRQGAIESWHDRRIPAGDNFDHSISSELQAAGIVLLLVSADFLASEYCYDVELQHAMKRQESGDCQVIPVILRHCDWQSTEFGKLVATPKDGKPVTTFSDLDEAFLQVVNSIKSAIASRSSSSRASANASPKPSIQPVKIQPTNPRSSDLRIKRIFTESEKDKFKEEAFDYIATYFENSLSELEARNEGIEGRLKRIDREQFTATVYRDGSKASFCRIFMGSGSFLSNGISYSTSEMSRNSLNESLSVNADDNSLYLRSMGMTPGGRGDQKLTLEGAASIYWSLFIEPLRR